MRFAYSQNNERQTLVVKSDVAANHFLKVVSPGASAAANESAQVEENDADGAVVLYVSEESVDAGKSSGPFVLNPGAAIPVQMASTVAANVGNEIASNASGEGKIAASGNWVAGIVIHSCAAGGIAVIAPAGYIKS